VTLTCPLQLCRTPIEPHTRPISTHRAPMCPFADSRTQTLHQLVKSVPSDGNPSSHPIASSAVDCIPQSVGVSLHKNTIELGLDHCRFQLQEKLIIKNIVQSTIRWSLAIRRSVCIKVKRYCTIGWKATTSECCLSFCCCDSGNILAESGRTVKKKTGCKGSPRTTAFDFRTEKLSPCPMLPNVRCRSAIP
jgi:hypothetical protein